MTISMRFASLKLLEDVPYKRLGKPQATGTQEHYLLYPEEKLTSVPSFKSIIEANITRKRCSNEQLRFCHRHQKATTQALYS